MHPPAPDVPTIPGYEASAQTSFLSRRPPCYNAAMIARCRDARFLAGVALLALFSSGCAQDRYEQRAEVIKDHVDAFYRNLESDKVASAVLENEQIEALARDMEQGLLQRAGQMDMNQKAQEWSLVKTAHETAADNWLALARYFVVKQQYEEARGTYQRVIETYNGKPDPSYAERARTGLHDLDRIISPSKSL